MNNVTYFEAWKMWLSGESVSQFYLFGLSILWWGRFGKIVGLVAGLIVISEIIGPERLLVWSSSLKTTININTTLTVMRDRWNLTIRERKNWKINFPFSGWLINYVFVSKKSKAINIAFVIGIIYIFFYDNPLVSIFVLVVLFEIFTIFSWYLIIPLVALPLMLLIVLFIFIVDFASQKLGDSLVVFSNDKYAKAISVALLIIGFHFDLLAS